MERELTAKQVECLNAVVRAGFEGVSPWDFGSTTISVLRNRGLIVKVVGKFGGARYVSKGNWNAALAAFDKAVSEVCG